MMSGVSLETCWAIKKHWNNKFYYTVASYWLFLYDLYCDARMHGHQVETVYVKFFALESRSARNCGKLSPYRPSNHVFHLRRHLHNISNNSGPDPEESKALTLKYVLTFKNRASYI